MNTNVRFGLALTLAVLMVAALLVTLTRAAPGTVPLAQGGAPAVIAYQGEVQVPDQPYTGDGYFKFAIVNATGNTTYWSNDGSSAGGSEPSTAIAVVVDGGLFNVLLGDTTLSGMTQALTAAVFDQPDRYLRVWFSSDNTTFDLLTPDTRVTAVPYALQAQEAVDADTVDGLHADELKSHYQNVVVVAQSGGDYASVQAALDSIHDAAADNPYLVWVAPGLYSETVTMKPYVHLQGAGQTATVITSTTGNSAWPLTRATLVLTHDVNLRDITVGNGSTDNYNAALLAMAGTTRTLASNVTAQTLGVGNNNYAMMVTDSDIEITLQQVTAVAEHGDHNIGLFNIGGTTKLYGGAFTARGGTSSYGIFNLNDSATLEVEDTIALAEHSSDQNFGFYNYGGAVARLHGGTFTGRGGLSTRGIENANNGSMLTADGVTAQAEDGGDNYAIGNYNVATATLSGGHVTARGGLNNYALSNELTATMRAERVTSLAENGSDNNYGVWNTNNATLTVHSADVTGRGGTNAYGIYNGDNATLEVIGVIALAEDGSNSYGLYNDSGSTTANVTQGVVGGATYSILSQPGTVITVSNAQLAGNVVSGPVTCVLVTRGTNVSTDGANCP